MAAAANGGDGGEWERTAEDDIIAMLHESGATNFCDPAFPPDTTSLYRYDAKEAASLGSSTHSDGPPGHTPFQEQELRRGL